MTLPPVTASAVPVRPPLRETPSVPVAPARTDGVSVFEPGLLRPAANAPVTDGRALVTAAVEDIRQRTAQGLKSTVVFDIDDTLTDTRARTLEIARAYDAANGTKHFQGLTLEQVTYPATTMAQELGLSSSEVRKFGAFWQPRFFAESAMDHDLGIEPMIQLAKDAAAAGAEVLFLTGRSEVQRDATLRELARLGVPQAETANLVMFQDGQGSAFKADQLEAWARGGRHLSFFITDSRGDIGLVQRRGLDLPAVLFDSPMSDPSAPVGKDTPVFPFPSAAAAFSPWPVSAPRSL